MRSLDETGGLIRDAGELVFLSPGEDPARRWLSASQSESLSQNLTLQHPVLTLTASRTARKKVSVV